MEQEQKLNEGFKVDWAQKKFSDEASAVKFVKDFWMHVNPRIGERIADYTGEQLREYTMDYRTALSGTEVTIYRNNSEPFSKEVVDFLRERGFME